MNTEDYLRVYVTYIKFTQATSAKQIIEKALSFIPAPIRPGYTCPAFEDMTYVYWLSEYETVADVLTEVADHNGWCWYTRDDGRIIFDVAEE
ncbi:MAG: hypothetical protein ACXWQ5_00520 [Ktedonobacterales bacterium]